MSLIFEVVSQWNNCTQVDMTLLSHKSRGKQVVDFPLIYLKKCWLGIKKQPEEDWPYMHLCNTCLATQIWLVGWLVDGI